MPHVTRGVASPGPDTLRGEDERVPCRRHQFGRISSDGGLHFQVDVARCRLNRIQKSIGTAGPAYEQAQFAVHDAAENAQGPNEIAFARAVRADQHVHVIQGERR